MKWGAGDDNNSDDFDQSNPYTYSIESIYIYNRIHIHIHTQSITSTTAAITQTSKDVHFVRAPKNFMAIQPHTIEDREDACSDTRRKGGGGATAQCSNATAWRQANVSVDVFRP